MSDQFAEMFNHARKAVVGETHMDLFGIGFDALGVMPWVVTICVAILGIGIAKWQAPALRTAWDDATII